MEQIGKYFSGEKIQCTIGIIYALISIGLCIYILTMQKPLFKGISYSVIPLSLFLLIVCVGLVLRTPNDIDRVTSFYQHDQSKIKTEELPRMEKVMNSFGILKKVEIALNIIGIILVFVFWKNELLRGIAIGLIIQGVLLYLFDHLAEARALPYYNFLQNI